ncbi:hypothetical protein [Rugosimonospora africana]|uniref:Uncharacterized protein n=1 Tax=Rugosimonospora africana TaxID=556532 RepID=A0A8J3QKY4_9ACTN|nr:hypothetical protein [Rugosimonospora africana]GIH12885.1 hypothetical protein Raf01_10570 [Rugosimonospora africana]
MPTAGGPAGQATHPTGTGIPAPREAASAARAGAATTGGSGSATATGAGGPAAGDGEATGTQATSATDRGGLTALAAALRSMTAARPIVAVAGKTAPNKSPSGRPLVMLCLWAIMLGLVGLGIGVRGLVVIIASHPASWFKPTLIISGLGGILLTACGFVTARRGILPWVFLGAATVVLIVSVVFSSAV